MMGMGLSLLCELINHNPLERKRASSGTHLVSSLGIYIIIIQAVVLIWGNETRVLRTGLDAVAGSRGYYHNSFSDNCRSGIRGDYCCILLLAQVQQPGVAVQSTSPTFAF